MIDIECLVCGEKLSTKSVEKAATFHREHRDEHAELHEHDGSGCLECTCLAGPPFPQVPCKCSPEVRSDVRPTSPRVGGS